MQLYQMDDYVYYAAESESEAVRLYAEDTGATPEGPDYPRECTAAELDREIPDREEGGEMTGEMTTMRKWLNEATAPGFLCGIDS